MSETSPSTSAGTLAGLNILVTGATGGIGSEIVRTLHREGARVGIHFGSAREQADELVAESGGCSVALHADLLAEGGPDGLWDDAVAALGRIDVLVNNAGLWLRSPFAPKEEWIEGWNGNMNINLTQAAWLTRRAVLDFEQQGGGTIISMSSRSALRGDDIDHLVYGVAKAGLQNLMKGVARAYAHKKIYAYAIAPAMVATKMVADHMDQAKIDALPMKEVIPPTDVAETVAFLASGRVRHMTGATIDITGADYVR